MPGYSPTELDEALADANGAEVLTDSRLPWTHLLFDTVPGLAAIESTDVTSSSNEQNICTDGEMVTWQRRRGSNRTDHRRDAGLDRRGEFGPSFDDGI